MMKTSARVSIMSNGSSLALEEKNAVIFWLTQTKSQLAVNVSLTNVVHSWMKCNFMF